MLDKAVLQGDKLEKQLSRRLSSLYSEALTLALKRYKAFFKKLAFGERAVVTDSNIIENFRNVDVNRTNIIDGVNDWIIARDKILEQFFRDIGIKMYNPKKAQVSEDEIEANSQGLDISKATIINPFTYEKTEEYLNLFVASTPHSIMSGTEQEMFYILYEPK